jgi:Lecithin retinol acyltransferase
MSTPATPRSPTPDHGAQPGGPTGSLGAPSPRFRRADHLRVRRWGLYWHHGVYIDDERVIEFGREPFSRKRQALIRPVTLSAFEAQGTAVVVEHPQHFLFGVGMGLPSALSRGEILARAEFLMGKSAPGRYNLIGANCEHLANWAVTGGYFESLQVRSSFAVLALLNIGLLVVWRKLGLRAATILTLLVSGASLGTVVYNRAPYRLWKDILDQWPAYEKGQLPDQ